MIIFCWILFILTEKINAGIFVKGKTHNIDPIGYGGAKDPASLQSPQQTRPKRDAEKVELRSPIALQWKIPEERLKDLKNKSGEHLSSASFNVPNIPDVQYYLELFPNVTENGVTDEIWIYLHLQNLDKRKIEADFKIFIETANVSFSKDSVFIGYESDGIKCCTMEELFDPEKNFIVDFRMTIKMDGTLSFEKEGDENDRKWDGGNFGDSLGLGLWSQEENKDLIFVAGGGKEIKAHKSVLSARSPDFAEIFESIMKDNNESKVMIEDFSFDIVEKAIKLCYHHSLVKDTTLEDKMELLRFFDKYNIKPLKKDLQNYLIDEIDASNVCRLTNAALISNACKLERKCTEFLQTCMKESKPVNSLDLLDKEFALKLLKNAFYPISE
uniref:BTB domain-containing protein n=1 Tax=Panagrolaimus davidi TaxID=227884 RepID=A0A914QD00_9BILA